MIVMSQILNRRISYCIAEYNACCDAQKMYLKRPDKIRWSVDLLLTEVQSLQALMRTEWPRSCEEGLLILARLQSQ